MRGVTARTRRTLQTVWATIMVALVLAGCAINPPLELTQLGTVDRVLLTDVPFHPQTDYECGPAALAGLLGAAGVITSPQALSPQVYLPGRQGSLQIELLAATRRADRIPYILDTTPESLLAQLEAGRPVLVFQNTRTPDFPLWHYAVLVGFDRQRNELYLNSASQQAMTVAAPAFLRSWNWAQRWAMLALRPGEVPVGAQPARYTEAVLNFETVAGEAAAAPAWEAAVQRWPAEPLPWLALGNQAYAIGRLQVAAEYYRHGLDANRQDSALTNNLASVLGEMGCPNAAQQLVRPLAERQASDSHWGPVLAATLAELLAQDGADRPACADMTKAFDDGGRTVRTSL
jgi:tetratricopeptide (TPR) repeat protein